MVRWIFEKITLLQQPNEDIRRLRLVEKFKSRKHLCVLDAIHFTWLPENMRKAFLKGEEVDFEEEQIMEDFLTQCWILTFMTNFSIFKKGVFWGFFLGGTAEKLRKNKVGLEAIRFHDGGDIAPRDIALMEEIVPMRAREVWKGLEGVSGEQDLEILAVLRDFFVRVFTREMAF